MAVAVAAVMIIALFVINLTPPSQKRNYEFH